MGDDIDDHDRMIEVSDDASLVDVMSKIITSGYLPSVSHQTVTWSVSSKSVLAVIAQGVSVPKILSLNPEFVLQQSLSNGSLRLHCSYIGHIDAETVSSVLKRISWPQDGSF